MSLNEPNNEVSSSILISQYTALEKYLIHNMVSTRIVVSLLILGNCMISQRSIIGNFIALAICLFSITGFQRMRFLLSSKQDLIERWVTTLGRNIKDPARDVLVQTLEGRKTKQLFLGFINPDILEFWIYFSIGFSLLFLNIML